MQHGIISYFILQDAGQDADPPEKQFQLTFWFQKCS